MSAMTLPYQEPLVPREPSARQIPEPPRRGEPGGPPCGICTGESTPPVWSDDNWTLHPPFQGSLPGTVWLASQTEPGRLPPTGGCSVQLSSDQTGGVVLPEQIPQGGPPSSPRRGGSGIWRSPGSRRTWGSR